MRIISLALSDLLKVRRLITELEPGFDNISSDLKFEIEKQVGVAIGRSRLRPTVTVQLELSDRALDVLQLQTNQPPLLPRSLIFAEKISDTFDR